MIYVEEKIRQILIVGISDSRSMSQNKYAPVVVSNKIKHKYVSRLFINALPEFLQVNPFAKKLTQQLTIKESISDLNHNFCH